MDGPRFDRWTRTLATARSRRGLLGSLLGVSAAVAGLRTTDAACPPGQVRAARGCVCQATGRPPGRDGCPCVGEGTQCAPGKVCSGGACVGNGECSTGLTDCGVTIPCGACENSSCVVTIEGAAICVDAPEGCGPQACASSADCPDGYICWPGSCCGSAAQCYPICTSSDVGVTAAGGVFPLSADG